MAKQIKKDETIFIKGKTFIAISDGWPSVAVKDENGKIGLLFYNMTSLNDNILYGNLTLHYKNGVWEEYER